MKTKLLNQSIFLFVLAFANNAYSQLNYLNTGASNITGAYTDLGTNGSIITTANFDNANSAPQNIGFTFNYNGSSYTQFILNTNGFIKLGNTAPSIDSLFFATGNGYAGGIFNSSNPLDANILAVFNHDLTAGTGAPEYRVYTSGSSGSQVCTIQFKNVKDKTTTPAIQYDNMEFQIKLYETTNTIEFIYGTWAPSANSSALKTAAIGLKGLDNTISEALVVGKVSSQSWSIASFLTGNYTGVNAFKFGNPTKPQPDAGRTFRFVQAFPNDAIVNLFTLGMISKPYGDARIDSAIVRNIGMNTLTNISVTLNISGANTFTDNQTIPSLAPGAYATIGFSPYSATALGKNTVTVTLSNDDNNSNNTDIYSQVVNNTTFSYADSTKAFGAISGQNFPGYMATRYTVIGTTSVTSANIYLANDAASIGKSVYAIVFDDLGNKLDSSAAITITPSDTGKYYNFSLPQTPIINNSSFYIGLAQPTVGYNALGYQKESAPVRLGAYFIRSMNSSSFTDMGGINGFNPYRLMIQAVITNTIGVSENSTEKTTTVYPNPFSTVTTFRMSTNTTENISLDLYDVMGRVVKQIKNINNSEFQFEREDIQSGIYFYTLSNAKNLIDSGKLIIE